VGTAAIATMHLAKGLEFRAVAVMAGDDEIITLQDRIEAVGDDANLQEAYDTERRLLNVACTRAQERFTSLLHHVSIGLLRVSFFAQSGAGSVNRRLSIS
jgi:superfamily I DNA/RNA helicase